MTLATLNEKAQTYLHRLCWEAPTRRTGSAGNRAATGFFAGIVAAFGWQTETPAFDCLDWFQDGADLIVDGNAFDVLVGPYSPGGQVSGPLAVISTVEELAAAGLAGQVVLLRGEIAKEQLMPKNFVFFNPDEHQRIIQLLETKGPLAIIAATTMDPGLAGAVSPFPLIEDGDFDIPSAYMTAEEGDRPARLAGHSSRTQPGQRL